MKKLFQEIFEIDQVQGIIFLSFTGETIYTEFIPGIPEKLQKNNWSLIASVLKEIKEAEIIYDSSKLYIFRAESGYLIIVMDKSTPFALVRLNCSIIQPALNSEKWKPKKLGRFFRRKNGE